MSKTHVLVRVCARVVEGHRLDWRMQKSYMLYKLGSWLRKYFGMIAHPNICANLEDAVYLQEYIFSGPYDGEHTYGRKVGMMLL